MNDKPDIDAIWDAYFAPQKMSREERKAWAMVNSGSSMQTVSVIEPIKPFDTGWVRVWRFDYIDEGGTPWPGPMG